MARILLDLCYFGIGTAVSAAILFAGFFAISKFVCLFSCDEDSDIEDSDEV